jgi:hypothetical protein
MRHQDGAEQVQAASGATPAKGKGARASYKTRDLDLDLTALLGKAAAGRNTSVLQQLQVLGSALKPTGDDLEEFAAELKVT